MSLRPNTYAQNLSLQFDNYLAAPSTVEVILSALGCSLPRYNNSQWELHVKDQPAPEHEALVRKTLIEVMRNHIPPSDFTDVHGVSLLEGLLRNDRWRDCLTNLDDAYDLAVLFMQFLLVTEHMPSLATTVYAAARKALHEWIQPTITIGPGMDSEMLTRHLFGDAWYEIVLKTSDLPSFDAPDLVRVSRPPFQSNLLADQKEVALLALPSLEL